MCYLENVLRIDAYDFRTFSLYTTDIIKSKKHLDAKNAGKNHNG